MLLNDRPWWEPFDLHDAHGDLLPPRGRPAGLISQITFDPPITMQDGDSLEIDITYSLDGKGVLMEESTGKRGRGRPKRVQTSDQPADVQAGQEGNGMESTIQPRGVCGVCGGVLATPDEIMAGQHANQELCIQDLKDRIRNLANQRDELLSNLETGMPALDAILETMIDIDPGSVSDAKSSNDLVAEIRIRLDDWFAIRELAKNLRRGAAKMFQNRGENNP